MEFFPKKHNHKTLYKGTLTYGIIKHFLLVSNNPQAQFHFNPQSIDFKTVWLSAQSGNEKIRPEVYAGLSPTPFL